MLARETNREDSKYHSHTKITWGQPSFWKTSSNRNIFGVTGPCEENPPVPIGFHPQRPVTRSFDVFFDLHLNKRLSKQSRRWWFEAPSHTLWRHCDVSHSNHKTKPDDENSYFWIFTIFRGDILKVTSGRPCSHKLSLLPLLFFLKFHLGVRNCLVRHVYGSTSCFKIMDNVTCIFW